MNFYDYSLKDIYIGYREGDIKSQDVLSACLENYNKTEESLHAYKYWNGEKALDYAHVVDNLFAGKKDMGMLMGMPVSAKDLYAVNGLPTYAGSSKQLPKEWSIPGSLINAVDGQLGLVTGKTHTVEFAFGGIGINKHWDTPVNPWNLKDHFIPGGSSSGAGVALSQGSCLLSLGTDTAGSVRIPASLTGNVGLKTTNGRWPGDGIVPLSSSLDTPGILARSVVDTAFAFQAIELGLGRSINNIKAIHSLNGLKFASFDKFFLNHADDAVVNSYNKVLSSLSALDANFSEIELPGCDSAYEIFQKGGLSAPELSAFLQTRLPDHIKTIDPLVRLRIEGAESLSSVEYLIRKQILQQAANKALSLFQEVDFFVSPTIAISAPRVSDLTERSVYSRVNMLVLRNTSIANLLGLCAITIPIGKDENGIPLGLQIMSAPNTEEFLLSVALKIESHFGLPRDVLGKP